MPIALVAPLKGGFLICSLASPPFFATANGDGKVDFWDSATGERRESFDWGIGKVRCVVFDRAGDRAACSSEAGDVVIWDLDR
jgi:WD40 repeat protein